MSYSRSSALFVFTFAVSGLALGAGCGKKEDPNTAANATATWGYGPNGGTAPPATTTAPMGNSTAPPPATTAAPAPTPTPTATTTAAPSATSFDASALQPLLAPLAAQHAKGAKADGPALGGVLQTGQSMQQNAQLAPGGTRCYTAIAAGLPSVTEIQLELWTNMPPLPPTIVAQAQTPANPAVLAGSPNCFKNVLPIPGMVFMKVTAKSGSGPVVAQLYSK